MELPRFGGQYRAWVVNGLIPSNSVAWSDFSFSAAPFSGAEGDVEKLEGFGFAGAALGSALDAVFFGGQAVRAAVAHLNGWAIDRRGPSDDDEGCTTPR
jgi:hypothetical protein